MQNTSCLGRPETRSAEGTQAANPSEREGSFALSVRRGRVSVDLIEHMRQPSHLARRARPLPTAQAMGWAGGDRTDSVARNTTTPPSHATITVRPLSRA